MFKITNYFYEVNRIRYYFTSHDEALRDFVTNYYELVGNKNCEAQIMKRITVFPSIKNNS